ncbi:hypothetical protein Ancab_005810 [Ancistrocladus abbreviatus]
MTILPQRPSWRTEKGAKNIKCHSICRNREDKGSNNPTQTQQKFSNKQQKFSTPQKQQTELSKGSRSQQDTRRTINRIELHHRTNNWLAATIAAARDLCDLQMNPSLKKAQPRTESATRETSSHTKLIIQSTPRFYKEIQRRQP